MRHRVHFAPGMPDRDQIGRSGQVPVPDVVMDALVIPAEFSGPRIQRQQAIGVEIRAQAVAAPKVRGRRTRRHVKQPPRPVDRHAGPAVRRSDIDVLISVAGPGVMAGLSRIRDRAKTQARVPVRTLKASIPAGSGILGFPHPRRHDQKILEKRARGRGDDKIILGLRSQAGLQTRPGRRPRKSESAFPSGRRAYGRVRSSPRIRRSFPSVQ